MKNSKRYFLGVFLLGAIVLMVNSCKDDFTSPPSPSGTTVGAAVAADPDLNIFVAALNKTNQAGSLANNNSGIFTVFAPTDSAFLVYFQVKLSKPAFTEDSVINYIDNTMSTTSTVTISALSTVLTYHILSSMITTDAVTIGQGVATLNGARLSLSKVGSNVFLNSNVNSTAAGNGAKFEGTETVASNGVFHKIDRVLIPISNASVAALLGLSVNYGVVPPVVSGGTSSNTTDTDFNLLAAAIKSSGLALTILPNVTPLPDYTVFGPNDGAFRGYVMKLKNIALPTEAQVLDMINNNLNANYITPADLAILLNHHVVAGRYVSKDLISGSSLTALSGSVSFGFDVPSSSITVIGTDTTALIKKADQLTNAGILHGLDTVLK